MDGDSKPQFNAYLDKIRERAKKSRIHSRHQMIGLMVADTLEDQGHKALYIKMARDENGEKMLYMAKSIAENPKIENKGAYFMKLWRLENSPRSKSPIWNGVSKSGNGATKKKKSPKSALSKKKNGNRNGKKPE
jgi:hypothetical protein